MKKKVIIIEDEKDWLDDITYWVNLYFLVDIKRFLVFAEAQKVLMNPLANFDLVITDIISKLDKNDAKGLGFIEFLSVFCPETPVIVVTAAEQQILSTIGKCKNVKYIFNKSNFDNMHFVTFASAFIPRRESPREEKRNNNDGSTDNSNGYIGMG